MVELLTLISKFLGTGAEIWLKKLTDAHLNKVASVKTKIAEADRQFQNETDNRDDLEYIKLHDDLKIADEAFMNQLRAGPPK